MFTEIVLICGYETNSTTPRPIQVDTAGRLVYNIGEITGFGYVIKRADINAVTGTAQTLIEAVEGKSIQVVGGHLECGVSGGQATILDGAAVIDRLGPGVGTSISIAPRPMTRPIWATTAGNALNITTQSGQTFTGSLEYIEV